MSLPEQLDMVRHSVADWGRGGGVLSGEVCYLREVVELRMERMIWGLG